MQQQNLRVIAAYLFAPLQDLEALKVQLRSQCIALELKGSILLAEEGINLMLAGTATAIGDIKARLCAISGLEALEFKDSLASAWPFKRLLIKIKPEIVTLHKPQFNPQPYVNTHLAPAQFKQWLDEKRDITVLDTRNTYETELGHFEAAQLLPLDHFSDFPELLAQLDPALKHKPLVMYCTGGVRCEKAIAVAKEHGFKDIYQLDGGILKYFEECGAAHYQGDCFVFDERVALTPTLQEREQ